MADIALDAQGTPTTPSSGVLVIYANSTTKRATTVDDAGKVLSAPSLYNSNTGDVVATSTDTYITGSSIAIPPQKLQVGATFIWEFAMSKTAAGTVTPVTRVRFGTAGTIADSARLTFTGVAQTAAIDAGVLRITAVVRSIGASGVIAGTYELHHNNASTGFTNQVQPNIIQVTSGAFDTTVASSIIGISVDPGASGVWTFQVVSTQVLGL